MVLKIIPVVGRGPSCNCYVLLDGEYSAIIDTGCDLRIQNLLRQAGVLPEKVNFVINTHCHADHTGCNDIFTDAHVFIHEADAKAVEDGLDAVTLARELRVEIVPKVDGILHDNDVVRVGESELRIIHTPGHTAGSICILVGDSLFSGDTIFAEGVGRTDLPTGNTQQLSESLKKIRGLEFTNLFPGHGPATTKERISSVTSEFF